MTERPDAPRRRGRAGGPLRRDHRRAQGPTGRIRHRDRRRDIARTFAMRACTCACSATTRERAALARRPATRRTASCSAASPRELRLKHTPTLEFVYDDTVDRGMRIAELLDEHEEERRRELRQRRHRRRASRCSPSCATPTSFVLDHAREPRRRRARLARRDAAGPRRARQGRASASWPPTSSRCPTSTASSSSTGSCTEPPADLDERTVVFLDCGNIDRNAGRRRSSATDAHILNIDHHHDNTRFGTRQPRRARRLVHGRDRVGPDAGPRRRRRRRTIAEALYVGLVTDTGSSCTRTPARART